MRLELTDEQTHALIPELSQTIDGDRYPLSPRIAALKEILGAATAGAGTRAVASVTTVRAAEHGAIPAATLA